ncbi:MAG: CbiX/SirB N-terminal domain-containing protein [Nostoc sp. ChiSLP02]|nr:CbiX/SirB N-terminal domain-containing protein [Nostoc sp. DedSLP05]MDZ8102910.1 CbiX/SirB N-terminal domain-containing protein [Nostoc sp. DedSLP01]MDZ8184078.1 CbiX/SirB N-terminal domain-containing protein [Nostoc sp. ChiSLP02]
MSSAYLLVYHGSSDSRPEIAMQELARLLRNKFDKNSAGANTEELLGIAALEMSQKPLHEEIKQFTETAFSRNKASHDEKRLKIFPLFMLPGVHVMTDIPAEVALAQQATGEDIIIELQPYLGSHPGLKKLLAKQIAKIEAQAWILLTHGSRRPDSQKPVEALAASLSAVVAYWSVPDSLELRVKELVAAGYKKIGILQYFLFAGGITDAIAASVEKLKLQFPAVTFHLTEPLGISAELADLIWDLIQE